MTSASAGWAVSQGAGRSGRLGGWADGYTADAVYLDQVNTDLSPTWLSMIAVLNGQPPLPSDRRITWLDIGSGTGLGACSIAAGNPNVDVWGVDYNPAHVERSRQIAGAAGLENCHFIEASFSDLATDPSVGPDEVDVVVVNGVYSWISEANRGHIRAAIGRLLRPGGLAFVMYEAATGWSSMVPLAEALQLRAHADGRPGDVVFPDAAAEVIALQEKGARYFPIGKGEAGQMASWPTADPRYAAHEYLGSNFSPLMVDDVAATMADIKCSLLGSIGVLDHHPFYSSPPEVSDLLTGATEPILGELIRDLMIQRPLRRDLYRKGRAYVTADDHRSWIRDIRVTWTGRPLAEGTFELPAMQVTLDPEFHGPLVEALGEGDLHVDAILATHPEWSFADATSALCLLIAGGYAEPVAAGGPSDEAAVACGRLNQVLMQERGRGHAHGCLADPSTGAMIEVDLVEALALDGLQAGAPAEVDVLVGLITELFAHHSTLR